MLIKTNDGIVNLALAQCMQIYVAKSPDVCSKAFWSVNAQTQSEGGDFALCDCDTEQEAKQALDKLWDAFRKNESSYDMT